MPPNTGSHAELYVHLVWSTWDRVPLLSGEVRDSAYRRLHDECRRMGVEVMAIGGVEDHVHLLVRMPAALSIAALAKQLKGATSHALNAGSGNRPFFRWQGGYGAFSVSRQHVERIRQYVLNQPEHHARGRIADFLEPQTSCAAHHAARTETAPAVREGGLPEVPAAGFKPPSRRDTAR